MPTSDNKVSTVPGKMNDTRVEPEEVVQPEVTSNPTPVKEVDNGATTTKAVTEETSAANPQPTPPTVVYVQAQPNVLGYIEPTPGMDESIPGGKFIARMENGKPVYVNNEGKEIDDKGTVKGEPELYNREGKRVNARGELL